MEFIADKTERLDKFLAAHYTDLSRAQFQRLIKGGAVKVNDHSVAKSSFKLRVGDKIVIPEKKILAVVKEFTIKPESDIPLNIVYEDNDILVINKPAGLLVHPTLSQRQHTLVNALMARYPDIAKVGESPLRPGIVHRLDKDTSGLIIVAKNQNAFLKIKHQFLSRTITKKYLALVEGVPKEKNGVIEYDIRPSKKNRLKKVAVTKISEEKKKSRRAARTLYHVRKIIGGKFALIEVQPLTGRTHQIRVHLAAIGLPITGDQLYGSKSRLLKRQFLHAYYLKFTAPNGTPIALETELPEDLKKALEEIKN